MATNQAACSTCAQIVCAASFMPTAMLTSCVRRGFAISSSLLTTPKLFFFFHASEDPSQPQQPIDPDGAAAAAAVAVMPAPRDWPLTWEVRATCSTTMARAGDLTLPHSVVHTPVFMPVGKYGVLPYCITHTACVCLPTHFGTSRNSPILLGSSARRPTRRQYPNSNRLGAVLFIRSFMLTLAPC